MNRPALALLLSAGWLLAAVSAVAQEKRFDALVFRPSAGPRDLVMVLKSEVIGDLSPTVGLYTDLAWNPLNLVLNQSTNSRVAAVTAGLTLTPMAGIGFFNWVDVTLAIPLVAWQTGANLQEIGSEGPVPSHAVGDMRLAARLSVPYFNRKDEIKSGFGLAVAGNVNLPTGNPAAFTGDGTVTGGPVLIADYRFGFGLLVAANAGVWFRPSGEFIGYKLGDMARTPTATAWSTASTNARRSPRAPTAGTGARWRTSRGTRLPRRALFTSSPTPMSSSRTPGPSSPRWLRSSSTSPRFRQVEIQVHTDGRASKLDSLYWSALQSERVKKALEAEGVDSARIAPRPFGHAAPIYADSQCVGPDQGLSQGCRTMTSRNQRVVFRIVRRGAPPPHPITGARDGNASMLPIKESVLPRGPAVLPKSGALPTQGVLPADGVLPAAGSNPGLPQATKALPDHGVLPRQGAPKKPDEPAPAREDAPKKLAPRDSRTNN